MSVKWQQINIMGVSLIILIALWASDQHIKRSPAQEDTCTGGLSHYTSLLHANEQMARTHADHGGDEKRVDASSRGPVSRTQMPCTQEHLVCTCSREKGHLTK